MSKFKKYKNKGQKWQGFTLIELSIVLIIIGLLIAGIAAGTSLYETVKLNSTITIEQQLQMAIGLFKSQYGALPGDFPYASSYWPSANCIPGDTNINPAFCDGNGDGIWGGTIGSADATAEGTRVLQHLQSAGLITGGSYVGDSGLMLLGVNAVPVPLYPDTGYNLDSGTVFLSPNLYNNLGNFIVLSSITFNGQPGTGAVTPSEAFYIDNKIDDGFPSTGNVLSYTGYVPAGPCTATVGGRLVYNFSEQTRPCVTAFKVPD